MTRKTVIEDDKIHFGSKVSDDLDSLLNEEHMTFEKKGKKFVTISKEAYDLLRVKEKAFDFMSKFKEFYKK